MLQYMSSNASRMSRSICWSSSLIQNFRFHIREEKNCGRGVGSDAKIHIAPYLRLSHSFCRFWYRIWHITISLYVANCIMWKSQFEVKLWYYGWVCNMFMLLVIVLFRFDAWSVATIFLVWRAYDYVDFILFFMVSYWYRSYYKAELI